MNKYRALTLESIYFVFHGDAGWLTTVQELLGLSNEDVHYLEVFDDAIMPSNIKLNDFLAKNKDTLRWGTFYCESEDEELSLINKHIAEITHEYEEQAKADKPVIDRMLLAELRGLRDLEKRRKAILGKKYYQEHPNSDQISPEMILRAREVPLERLVEVDRTSRIICPFHDDSKPSMWVKRGFGYCFSCGESCDSIRWKTDVDGMKFVDAVRSLV